MDLRCLHVGYNKNSYNKKKKNDLDFGNQTIENSKKYHQKVTASLNRIFCLFTKTNLFRIYLQSSQI